jgi:drug/metabolite transporter (DMT)-like permease
VHNLLGDFLSLLGTIAIVIHMLLGKSLRSSISAFVYSFLVFFMAGNVLAVYNVCRGISFTSYGGREWGIFLLLAIVPTLFGHYLFNWLLKYMKASSVSMSVLGEPLGATVLAYFLLNEAVPPLTAGAGLLLLLGVWMFMKGSDLEKKKNASSDLPTELSA